MTPKNLSTIGTLIQPSIKIEQNQDLELGDRYSVVDLYWLDALSISKQGSNGETPLSDPLFALEKSQITTDKDVLKYCSLKERLSDSQLEMIRKSSVDILSSLASSHESFIWFVSGLKLVEEPDEAKGEFEYPEEYYTIDACCDRMRINGRVSIIELSRDDLEYYSQMLGSFDAVRGIAIEPGRMADVLSVLSLTEPIPSSQRGYLVETVSYKSLIAVLELGSFFFEEMDNGTRLRFVGKQLDRQNTIATIEKSIEEISQTSEA